MVIEKNIYDKIKEVIITHHERIRRIEIKERESDYIPGGKKLLIYIPKKEEIFYHGSYYDIDCDEKNRKCDIRGELVTTLKTSDDVRKKIEGFTCDVLAIHKHYGISIKSTHAHFICENKNYDDTIKITKFLKEH